MASGPLSRARAQVAATSFLALFSISGLGFYGLSFFFDFMVCEFGWTLLQVTSGNAFGTIVVGPLFGFGAGWIIDRFGPRRLMVAGVCSMGLALFGGSRSLALALAFAVVFGVAAGGDYLMIPLMAAELFGVKVLGRLLGIVLTADGIAEALVPMLVGHLRDTTKSYAAGFFVLITLALVGALAVAMLPRALTPDPPRE
jgi:MFS family permease